jgi:cyclic pyranopterin monophosphate synthase
MVDVGDKPISARSALAEVIVRFRPDVLDELVAAGGPKGDAFVTARLAGIAAAKRTAELIPLCHPLPLDRVDVEIDVERASGAVTIRAGVAATARTGVEMEALTAAGVAALTLYDMAKPLQRDIVIERLVLLEKHGGRSGSYRARAAEQKPPTRAAPRTEPPVEAVVVTVSDRSAVGERADRTGPAVVAALRDSGFAVGNPLVVADDAERLRALLGELADAGHRLVVTAGGTGLGPRDATPEATADVIEREVPGMAEQMRLAGLASTPMASLSRGIVGIRGRTLIVNLPGSPTAAVESLGALLPVLGHALEQLAGADH